MTTSPKIHATTTTVTTPTSKTSFATVSSVEAIPNAIKYTTYGNTEAAAGVALCRKMVEEGYDMQTKIDLPAVNAKILGAAV